MERGCVDRISLSLRRTIHVHTGLLRDPQLRPINGPTTFALAMRLEDEPTFVRVGFANDTALDYQLTSVAACISSDYGDGVNPVGDAPWALLKTNGGGRDSEAGTAPSGRSRKLLVRGNGGGPRVPNVAWTDWTPIEAVASEDGSGRPILFIRVCSPAWSLPRSCMSDAEGSAALAEHGRPVMIQMKAEQDAATQPALRYAGFGRWQCSPVYCVQYLGRTPGATVLWGGDSHFAGTRTVGNVDSFGLLSSLRLSTPELPVAAANYAWSGCPSVVFLPLLENMMEVCRPQIVLLQGWTANDGNSEAAANAYAERVLRLAGQARAIGARPVLVTRFARRTLARNLAEKAVADRLRQQQLALNEPALPVLDATPILEDPAEPGMYRAGFSEDGVHPNGLGHAALAERLTGMLQEMLGG